MHQDLVNLLEKRIDETEKVYEEISCLREAAKKAAEAVPVVNQELVNQLTSENEHLKVQKSHLTIAIFPVIHGRI